MKPPDDNETEDYSERDVALTHARGQVQDAPHCESVLGL